MQESLDNMLLDLFKHSRNLEGQIAVTGQLIAYSQKAGARLYSHSHHNYALP